MTPEQKVAKNHLDNKIISSQKHLMMLAQAADRVGAAELAEAVRRAAIIAVAHLGDVRRG
jgi:hypothetical protein